MEANTAVNPKRKPPKLVWLWGVLPLLLLGFMIYFITTLGTGIKDEPVAPIEALEVQKITLTDEGFTVDVLNTGPEEVTIAQVLVNDAFWNAEFSNGATLKRFGETAITIPYGWVEGDPYEIKLLTGNGLIFTGEVAVAAKTPVPDASRVGQYALIGFYVGVVPVGLGLLWFPFLRRFSQGGMQAVLALTVGLLFFLVVDTLQEGLELGAEAPGIFHGTGLVWFGAFLSFLFLLAIDQSSEKRNAANGKHVAYKIAGGIGLHNLGEGLAIGAAFAAGEAALGTFLVIGFTLHNVTEGIGIAAPLLNERPTWRTFLGLAVVGGAPAIIGTWTGGFVFNETFAALFFGVGAGAIMQVIYVISKMIVREAGKAGKPVVSWLNFGGLTLGILLMYVTALFVSV
ncbi:ZIP family metal transporter [Paenibacillus silvisoli]|uniref:ZIP family metal transporter n=1 Tax=Paenibacillus silvisoli TaxID=3110539 RepID=UPI002803F6F2|nr:ZIP family metal transporter [Paenibacillus silvisoli]